MECVVASLGIIGASGFIGRALSSAAERAGHTVRRFSRSEQPGYVAFRSAKDLANLDWLVNLAGEPILGLWTAGRRRRILESRVEGTRRIVDALPDTGITSFVNASAIGFYGDTQDRVVNEKSPPGTGFLAETTHAWENAAHPATLLGVRLVLARIGFVLGNGGAMRLMRPVFQCGLGGKLGSGRQWMSCIHVEDVAGMILHALQDNSVSGPMNVVMPSPVRNVDFTRLVADSVKRPALIPGPAFLLRTLLGDLSHVMLDSSRVKPEVALASGYEYSFGDVASALAALASPK